MIWWQTVIVALSGVAVGGGIGLLTARMQARWADLGLRRVEQEKLIATTRSRRVELYDPLIKFVWTMEEITTAPPVLWGDDTPDRRRERHQEAIDKQRTTFSDVSARTWLESSGEELHRELQDLWVAFQRHQLNQAMTPNPVYKMEDRRAAVDDIVARAKRLVSHLKADIAQLDGQASALVAVEGATREPRRRLRGR